MTTCKDVCRYGNERRLDRQACAARKLLKKVGGPYFEVRVGRQSWQQPGGELHKLSLTAAKQVQRNALDKLHMPGMAAVGMLKVAFVPGSGPGRWHVEIHQVVAGATREEVTKAFSTRLDNSRDNYLRVDPVNPLGLKQIVRRVLDQVVMLRQQPDDGSPPVWPEKGARREYYR
jgi:hypothetical protein